MSQTQLYTDGLQTLKEVVKKALWASKKNRINYWLYFELAIDGYRYLNLHAVNEGREWKKLTIDTVTNTIDFPIDFEDFIGVYEPIDGEFWPLTRNDNIVITTSLTGLTETQDSTDGEGVDITNPSAAAPYVRGGINVRGYYTIDWNNRRIFFSNVTATDVVLLYKSSGTYINATTYVPNKYIPFLIAYIQFEFTKYDDRYSNTKKQELSAILNVERLELARLESPTLDEYLDAVRTTYYGTARR